MNVDSAFYSSGPSSGPSQGNTEQAYYAPGGNSVKKGKCHNCGKEGHFARDCRAAPRQNNNNNGNTSSGDRGGRSQGQTRENFTQGQGQSRGYQGPPEKFIPGFIDPRSRMTQQQGQITNGSAAGPSCLWPGCGKNDHDIMDCPKMAQHALARQR